MPKPLIVLHATRKDVHLGVLALQASHALAGQQDYPFLLAAPSGTPLEEVMEAASAAFLAPLPPFLYQDWQGDPSWPRPQNHAWQTVARHIAATHLTTSKHWFWWEADATPIRPDWLNLLSSSIPSHAFAGHTLSAPNGDPYMNGVAFWPTDIINHLANCSALYTTTQPFDIAAGRIAMSSFKKLNHLLLHQVKPRGGLQGQSFSHYTFRALLDNHPQAVFYHGCTDGTLHHLAGAKGSIALSTSPAPQLSRPQLQLIQMNETSKAMRRRHCEDAAGTFPWSTIFTGSGLDVGAGADPIQLPNCRPFDMLDGDANHLSRLISASSLDYLHASQCLEHMHDPYSALLDWSICLKPGGHLIFTVPDFTTYEKSRWPSRFNPDHKSAWSMWRRAAPGVPIFIHVPTFCSDMTKHGLITKLARFVDTNYDYLLPDDIDQSFPQDGAEMWIEVVMQKQS